MWFYSASVSNRSEDAVKASHLRDAINSRKAQLGDIAQTLPRKAKYDDEDAVLPDQSCPDVYLSVFQHLPPHHLGQCQLGLV